MPHGVPTLLMAVTGLVVAVASKRSTNLGLIDGTVDSVVAAVRAPTTPSAYTTVLFHPPFLSAMASSAVTTRLDEGQAGIGTRSSSPFVPVA